MTYRLFFKLCALCLFLQAAPPVGASPARRTNPQQLSKEPRPKPAALDALPIVERLAGGARGLNRRARKRLARSTVSERVEAELSSVTARKLTPVQRLRTIDASAVRPTEIHVPSGLSGLRQAPTSNRPAPSPSLREPEARNILPTRRSGTR